MGERLARSLSVVVDDQVKRILSDISWIEYRLSVLGDSEEDQIERRLLSILKNSLVKDLESLLAFRNNGYKLSRAEESIAS
ncbi:MAG: hypothetical protein QXS85_05520 [Acidilobaceae archaeon]